MYFIFIGFAFHPRNAHAKGNAGILPPSHYFSEGDGVLSEHFCFIKWIMYRWGSRWLERLAPQDSMRHSIYM